MAGRGKKVNQVKNERAHADWMAGKKLGRPKQEYVETHQGDPCNFCAVPHDDVPVGACAGAHWEKV